jgi:hypothetical protein
MKLGLLFILMVALSNITVAQDAEKTSMQKLMEIAPKIKKTTLTLTNDKAQYKIDKWSKISDSKMLIDLFAIENSKFWTGQEVMEVKVLGWWGLDDAAIAYIYNVKLKDSEGSVTNSTFLTTQHGITGKGVDNNPFELLPSPTGMKGKVTVTKLFAIDEFGAIKASNTHKSSNGKVLSKKNSFYVNAENGKITESGK